MSLIPMGISHKSWLATYKDLHFDILCHILRPMSISHRLLGSWCFLTWCFLWISIQDDSTHITLDISSKLLLRMVQCLLHLVFPWNYYSWLFNTYYSVIKLCKGIFGSILLDGSFVSIHFYDLSIILFTYHSKWSSWPIFRLRDFLCWSSFSIVVWLTM